MESNKNGDWYVNAMVNFIKQIKDLEIISCRE